MPIRVPPPEIPIVSFLTPNKSDQGLLEFWNTEIASYVPLDIGAAHPNARQYPNFRLGKQTPVQGDEKWTLRIWVTDETNPDWFNWAEKFAGEDTEFPTFIRTYREPRNSYTPRTKGEPLKTLYKLVITDPGSGYTNGVYPNITFDAPVNAPTSDATAHGVVAPDGTITEAVLDFGGEGYDQDVEFNVDPPINGNPAKGIAYVQPQAVILTREEAQLYPEDSPFYAQYLQVARVYETIPGPTFNETRLDIDGAELDVATTRKFCSDITTGEAINTGVWCKTTSKPTDIDVICEEEVACRPIPGNPMVSTKIDEDGKVITRTQTYTATASCVSSEAIVTGVWTKKYIEDVDGTNLVSWQWVESRDVPGNPMVSVKIDKDGKSLSSVRTLKDTTTITPAETVSGGIWTTTGKEAVSDLVAYEVVTARTVKPTGAANNVVSYSVDGDSEVATKTDIIKETGSITPSATESGGTITTVEADAVTDLVAHQITTTVDWLDKAEYAISIINLIPREFMAFVPTFTESHILAGTAGPVTLTGTEFEHSQRQLTKLLYEDRTVSLGSVSLPITHTNQELTEEYGGGVLNVTYKLNTLGADTIEQGLLVVSSEVIDLGNGMQVRTTKVLDDTAWSVLSSRLWDDNYRVEYDETRQVVAAGTSEDPDPGGVFAWVSEVKSIDKWRSWIVNTSKPTPDYDSEANALISYEFKPFKFPGLLTTATFGYYVRSSYAELIQHKLRTWWLKSATTPTVTIPGGGGDVEIEEIIPDTIIISTLNDVTVLAYSGMVLHDDLTTFGSLFWPETTPNYTDYIASWQGVEKVIAGTVTPEKEKDIWKIVTESVVMR